MLKARLDINACRSGTNYYKGSNHCEPGYRRERLNSAREAEARVTKPLNQESEIPLFLREAPEGQKGDAQDEKDKSAE